MQSAPSYQHDESMRPGAELRHLGPAHIERFHQAVLDILERTGVIVAHESALELLKAGGARVDGQRVRIPARMIEAALASAPKMIEVCDRLGAW